MNGRMTQLGNRGRAMLAGFTPGQRGIILVAVAALVLGAVALGRWAAQPSWTTLYANLSPTDASAIVDQLKSQNVPYQLTGGGGTIMVPQAQVYELRVAMAGKGLTANSESSGYSVLDKQGMTATDFQQNVAYQRALETELAKTLQAIGGVDTAMVHLAIPKRDVFTTDTDRPTAAVLLALSSGTTLSRAQIRSVMHLVGGSVPGLDPSDVTVTDAGGNLLSVREDGQAGAVGAASEADQQTQAFEDARSAALQKMLDKVLGPGKAVVRVNAELNFDSSETTSKSYLTQTGITPLSEATSSESYQASNAGGGGVLGQTVPSLSPGLGGGGGTYIKVEATRDNPVGVVTSDTKAAPGSVKRLTVSVVVDSKAGANTTSLQTMVSNAIGYSQTRGDSVQVTAMPFDTTAATTAAKELAQAQSAAKTAQYLDLGKKAGIGLLAVIIAVIALRRGRGNGSGTTVEAVASDLPGSGGMLPAGGGAGGGAGGEPLAIGSAALEALEAGEPEILDPTLERERLRDEVAMFVDQQPEEIAAIVQTWLGQRKN
jgi:flagellar M-ring protein FliF